MARRGSKLAKSRHDPRIRRTMDRTWATTALDRRISDRTRLAFLPESGALGSNVGAFWAFNPSHLDRTFFPLPFMVVGFGDGTQNHSWRRLTDFEDCHVQCTCPGLRRSRPLGFRRCQFISNAHLLNATWPDAVPGKGSVGKRPEVRTFGGTLRAQP